MLFPFRSQTRSPRRTRRPSKTWKPAAAEHLEPRLLLSCNAVQVDAALYVTGDAGDNHIELVDDGEGNVSVLCARDGDPEMFRGVEEIFVDAGEGDDTVLYTGEPNKGILIGNGGDGSRLHVDAGAGDDRVSVYGLGHVKVFDAQINLGDGNDELQVTADGYEQINLDVIAGSGDDEIVGLLFPAIHKVRSPANRPGGDEPFLGKICPNIQGGTGDDVIIMTIANPPTPPVPTVVLEYLVLGTFAGGAGDDVITVESKYVPVRRFDLDSDGGSGDVESGGRLFPAVH
jgi:hypothetical protein